MIKLDNLYALTAFRLGYCHAIGRPHEMKTKALLYVGLLIALSGCTGLAVKNELPPNKEQTFKHLGNNPSITKNHIHTKGKSNQRTNRMLAWIELSKN